MYEKHIKRLLDFVFSLLALIILSPLLVILAAVGALVMHGNPFFTQQRPGLHEKIFRMIKFRTMDNRRDTDGSLLSDDERINGYGRFLRKTSLDELPELINILKGDMAIVGPRPLLVKYLPYYTAEERRRHDVRPGLTGYAQAHGRNNVSWEERFRMDIWYVDHLSPKTDISVLIDTVKTVLKHDGIVLNALEDLDEYRKHAASVTPQ